LHPVPRLAYRRGGLAIVPPVPVAPCPATTPTAADHGADGL